MRHWWNRSPHWKPSCIGRSNQKYITIHNPLGGDQTTNFMWTTWGYSWELTKRRSVGGLDHGNIFIKRQGINGYYIPLARCLLRQMGFEEALVQWYWCMSQLHQLWSETVASMASTVARHWKTMDSVGCATWSKSLLVLVLIHVLYQWLPDFKSPFRSFLWKESMQKFKTWSIIKVRSGQDWSNET